MNSREKWLAALGRVRTNVQALEGITLAPFGQLSRSGRSAQC